MLDSTTFMLTRNIRRDGIIDRQNDSHNTSNANVVTVDTQCSLWSVSSKPLLARAPSKVSERSTAPAITSPRTLVNLPKSP